MGKSLWRIFLVSLRLSFLSENFILIFAHIKQISEQE